MVGNGVGARKGILFKTAASLEETGRVNVVALDKTGTITMGKSQVTNIVTAPGVQQEELLKLALSFVACLYQDFKMYFPIRTSLGKSAHFT